MSHRHLSKLVNIHHKQTKETIKHMAKGTFWLQVIIIHFYFPIHTQLVKTKVYVCVCVCVCVDESSKALPVVCSSSHMLTLSLSKSYPTALRVSEYLWPDRHDLAVSGRTWSNVLHSCTKLLQIVNWLKYKGLKMCTNLWVSTQWKYMQIPCMPAYDIACCQGNRICGQNKT